MNTMNPNNELDASLKALKQTAISLDDIQAWLTANHAALLGGAQLPDGAKTLVRLSVNHDDIIRTAVIKENITACVTHEISYPGNDKLSLSTRPDKASGMTVVLRQEAFMELKLSEWPLVSALLTTKYIGKRLYTINDATLNKLGITLDKYVPQHFPGWTIDKLIALAESGILPTHKNGEIQQGVLEKMLFDSRSVEKTAAKTLPSDFIP